MPWRPTNPKFFTAYRRLRPCFSDRFLKCEVRNKNQQKLFNLEMCQAIPNSIAMAQLLGKTNWVRRKALICSAKHHSMFIAFPICLFFISKPQHRLRVVGRLWISEEFRQQVFALLCLLASAQETLSSFLKSKKAFLVVSMLLSVKPWSSSVSLSKTRKSMLRFHSYFTSKIKSHSNWR